MIGLFDCLITCKQENPPPQKKTKPIMPSLYVVHVSHTKYQPHGRDGENEKISTQDPPKKMLAVVVWMS